MSMNFPKRLSWTAWASLRVVGILLALGGGASLLQGELVRGADLDRQIREKSDEAETRIDQGARAKQFHEIEEPLVREIEGKLHESIPQDANGFMATCLAEKEAQGLTLTSIRCEKVSSEGNRKPSREDRPKSGKESKEKETAAPASFVEVPFTIQGHGSYGGILRFADRVQTNRGLVAIDKFAIARSSVFGLYNGPGRAAQASKTDSPEEELPPESHNFTLEGRVFVQAEKGEEGH